MLEFSMAASLKRSSFWYVFGIIGWSAAAYVWVDAFRQYAWRAVPAVEPGKSSDRESGLRLDLGLIGYYRVSGGSECVMGGSGSRKTWMSIVIEAGFSGWFRALVGWRRVSMIFLDYRSYLKCYRAVDSWL